MMRKMKKKIDSHPSVKLSTDNITLSLMFQFKSISLDDITVKNIVISPNFLAWKFCGKAEFVSFHKISTPGN